METQLFIMLLCVFSRTTARHNVVPQFNAQDSAIIVDIDQPPPLKTETFPYYQPVQNQPVYRILHNKLKKQQNSTNLTHFVPPTASIFTQAEFPRDLLEVAQQKLGLKTLDEVPSITELAELLGTNSAAETIRYIRQLTSTEQGIALMKAYIESSDYTDNIGSKQKVIATTTTPKPPQLSQNNTQPGFFKRVTNFLNIYSEEPQKKQLIDQQVQNITSTPQFQQTVFRSMRPLYVRSPLPYQYPIPIRPLNVSRTALRKNVVINRQYMPVPTSTPPHLNTLKSLNPVYIQQLARIANVSSKKLESFLQRKPKLAELAAKLVSFPTERNAFADGQLLAAVQKVMEQDEDLKKLLNSSNTLK